MLNRATDSAWQGNRIIHPLKVDLEAVIWNQIAS